MSNIKPDPEKLKIAIDNFLNESAPYYDALTKIAILKPQKYLVDFENSKVTNLPSEDTKSETNIKELIEFIRVTS